MAATFVPAFNQAIWTVTPLLTPSDMHALSLVSTALHAMMVPASERVARVAELTRELEKLPFVYAFSLPPLGPDALGEALGALRLLKPLRRRELVGRGVGWAPTDLEPWRFPSWADLDSVLKDAQAAMQAVQCGARPPLLLAATFRRCGEQAPAGPVVTASVGVEWIDGPAADPLQLGLRLEAGYDGHAKIDLEVGSGAWSPWADTWALRDHTLEANVAVAATLPGRGRALLMQPFRQRLGEEEGPSQVESCTAEGAAAFAEALTDAGSEGVRAVVCVGGLRWGKEAPAWCPPEVRRVVAKGNR